MWLRRSLTQQILGKYLQDSVHHAKSTQDSCPSLHISFYHNGQSVGRVPPLDYSPRLDLAADFIGNNDIQLPFLSEIISGQRAGEKCIFE